jgi:hypothetical protein
MQRGEHSLARRYWPAELMIIQSAYDPFNNTKDSWLIERKDEISSALGVILTDAEARSNELCKARSLCPL